MSFDPNVPNASQSPGLFPMQNSANFAQLKKIITKDHVFNDTAQATDGYHRQMTMIARSSPGSLPTGANSILYTSLDGASKPQLRFYNGTKDYQITPTQDFEFGTVNIMDLTNFFVVHSVPANVYGEIFFFKDLIIQPGAFVSNATVVNGYTYGKTFSTSSSTDLSVSLTMAFSTSATNLDLKVKMAPGNNNSGVWSYRLFYRAK